mmetsp:Transcript_34410/g.101155  ORF Transcript_34410/g.101155 Transcript_34410/m.101155 type:complete len:651 (+) Transcript_34410:204-2156(+)
MATSISGRTLVRGTAKCSSSSGPRHTPLLYSDVGLSFWGGIDPATSIIIDHTHPLRGQAVADTILAIPSGRGSCTGSQVLLELILNGIAPRAIITRDVDPILCVGAIIAEEVFGAEVSHNIPTIMSVGRERFDQLTNNSYAMIAKDATTKLPEGSLLVGSNENEFSGISMRNDDNSVVKGNGVDFSLLQLSEEERAILDGRSGTAAEQIAMRTICRIASITDAPKLIPVTQAHIDGCTYIGPGGLRFVERLVKMGGKVNIPTTLNSVSADRRRWASLGVSSDLAVPANAVGDAYLKLGCTESFTCAPYLLPTKPGCGEDICWGESNAVVYSNSVLGARTEKVADYVDICSAITGRVPFCGVYLDANRRPGIAIDVKQFVNDYILPTTKDTDAFWPILGHVVGILSDGEIPIVVGLEELDEEMSQDDLKAFCAAFGTTGSSPLVHIAGITPEAKESSTKHEFIEGCHKRAEITYQDVRKSYEMLDSGRTTSSGDDGCSSPIELVAFGNPHLSLDECAKLASLMTQAPEKEAKVKVMATLSRHVYDLAKERGHVETMESFGVTFINDTCWCMLLDAPIVPPNPKALVMTNSGKYAHYGPGLTNRGLRFGSMAQCVEAATGNTRLSSPRWLTQKRGIVSLCGATMSRGRLRLR